MDWTIVLTTISAIGATTAAGTAAWQAYETRKQVGKPKSQGEMARKQFLQVHCNETRPVLLIVSNPQSIPLSLESLDWESEPPTIDLWNVGNGPALNVRSVIYGPEARAIAHVSPSSKDVFWRHLSNKKEKEEREKHWYGWTAKIVHPGEPEKLLYTSDGTGTLGPIQFSGANKFIETKSDKSCYPFNAPKQSLSPPILGEPWPLCRVTITYQDIFHRKYASIYDLVFRQRWQVVALINDIENDLDDLVKRNI